MRQAVGGRELGSSAVGNWGKISGDKTVGKNPRLILKPRFENKIARPEELMTLAS